MVLVCQDLFVWDRLKPISDSDIGPDPGSCGINGGNGGRRLGGMPRTPSAPR
mgnify:CR=1 FL=1